MCSADIHGECYGLVGNAGYCCALQTYMVLLDQLARTDLSNTSLQDATTLVTTIIGAAMQLPQAAQVRWGALQARGKGGLILPLLN